MWFVSYSVNKNKLIFLKEIEKMKLRKAFVTLTALTAITVTTFAAPTQTIMTKDEATKLVLQMMPRGSEHLSTSYDTDDQEYEVKIHNGGTKEKFEVKVDAVLKSVEELDSETYVGFDEKAKNRVKKNGKYNPKLNEKEIIALVERTYPGAVVKSVELEKDNGFWIYEVEFKSTAVYGSLEMDPETGRTLERDLTFNGLSSVDKPTTLPSDEIVEGVVTENQAIQKIYNKLPKGSTFVGSKRIIESQKVKYEMTFTYKAYHIEVTVDGSNGLVDDAEVFTLQEVDKNAVNRYENGRYVAKYSPAQIEAIVLKHIPEGKVTNVQMSLSRNLWVYDVDVTLENGTMNLIVCPETGALMSLDLDMKHTEVPMVPIEPSKPVKPEVNDKLLTEAQVKALVMKLVPSGKIIEIELDKDDNKWIYEVEVIDAKYEYNIEIDAKTGKTVELDKEALDDDFNHGDHDDDERDDD